MHNPKYINYINPNHGKMILTVQGREYLIEHYPTTENCKILSTLGCTNKVLDRFRNELGLYKTKEHISAVNTRNSNLRDASYIQKAKEGFQKYRNSKRIFDVAKRTSAKRKHTYRMEYIRMLNGEELKTNLIFREPYSKKRIEYRRKFKNLHYIPLQTRSSLVFYYSEDTDRRVKVEQSARKVGFKFYQFR